MILTYEQQLDLVARKLATVSINGKFSTFKYAKKVMYNYLWNDHPEVKECRGHTYDNTNGNLVLLPPAKTFNYLENDTWKDKSLDTQVFLYKKYNGFMASASIYQGEFVVGTTGSTKSDYAVLARKHIEKQYSYINKWGEGCTWLFEICDESDPHIVNEEFGWYYLGGRDHMDGVHNFIPVSLNKVKCTLKEALELAETDKGEGWMMYNAKDVADICKLKTDYYVGKKKLMRMTGLKIHTMYNGNNGLKTIIDILPDRWKHAPRMITLQFSPNEWVHMQDQQRRVFLESIE